MSHSFVFCLHVQYLYFVYISNITVASYSPQLNKIIIKAMALRDERNLMNLSFVNISKTWFPQWGELTLLKMMFLIDYVLLEETQQTVWLPWCVWQSNIDFLFTDVLKAEGCGAQTEASQRNETWLDNVGAVSVVFTRFRILHVSTHRHKGCVLIRFYSGNGKFTFSGSENAVVVWIQCQNAKTLCEAHLVLGARYYFGGQNTFQSETANIYQPLCWLWCVQ